ncbi:MAG TPA: squalene--hopene cyclase [Thermoanaerobaculia bacterium]|nr:squalene--hopene cyclase [Thermoanaerobaculia bacterium]
MRPLTPGEPDPDDPGAQPISVGPAVAAARRYLLSIQREDGHWCGELEGDTILESEYVLLLHFLGATGERRVQKAAEYIRRQQLPEGGWAIYPGGPAEVSCSVKAYFVLKLVGDDPQAPHMVRAREVIRGLGGIAACNSFTRIYLAIFGQADWADCPAVPPELVLLPDWMPFNIYRMSSWSRAIVVPLSIIWASKPFCAVPESASLADLVVEPAGETRLGPVPARSRQERLWRTIFFAIDRGLKRLERSPWKPLRKRALRKAEGWILARLEKSGGLGAIFPPIINTVFALRCLGYPADHPKLVSQVEELRRLEIEEDETLRVQPCFSAVWDTAIALLALRESGLPPDHPELLRAARWLVEREVRLPGDWQRRAPNLSPGGWFFEYENEFYPDTDDTAEVLSALASVEFPDARDDERRLAALSRGRDWQIGMQNRDGGWGAFDRECDNEILTWIPFADHNAMIDPSCEDITGRTLHALELLGHSPESSAPMARGITFLKRKQEPDGTWYGRWGSNYVYGTWLALRGLKSAGVDLSEERWQRAAVWLRRHQNSDGGWGELPRSYDDPASKGVGPSTPSQTAWGLLALLATGQGGSDSARRAVEYLLCHQLYDGSWKDAHWTGTGFPKVFYLRYHLYATYFPLWALAVYETETAATAVPASLAGWAGEELRTRSESRTEKEGR